MKDSRRFWDRIANRYSKQPVRNQEAYAETLDATCAHLRQGDRVLEVGCGTGSTALALSPQVAEIFATDLSGAMIDIAEEKRANSKVDNVRFVQAEADMDYSEAGPFDVILAFNTLHVLPDPEAVLHALFQNIRPGGLFISKSACLRDMNVLIRFLIPIMQLFGKAPTVSMFTMRELLDMMTRAGFEVIETRTFSGAPKLPFVVARRPL